MTPEWKGEVPTLDLLNRMVTDPLPLGLRSGPVEPFFQRDIYFDSADWTLRRRGVSCRFRIRVDDRRILTLRTVGRWAGARGHVGPGAPPPLPDRPGAAPPPHSVRNRAALAIRPGRLVFPGPLRRRLRCRDGSQPSDGAGVRGAEAPRARSGPAGPRPAGPGASATVRAPAAARGKGGPRRQTVARSGKRRPGAGRARRPRGGRGRRRAGVRRDARGIDVTHAAGTGR